MDWATATAAGPMLLSGRQPGVLDGQVFGALHPADRAGPLDQSRGQPLVAVPRADRPPLPTDSCIPGASPAEATRSAAEGNGGMPAGLGQDHPGQPSARLRAWSGAIPASAPTGCRRRR